MRPKGLPAGFRIQFEKVVFGEGKRREPDMNCAIVIWAGSFRVTFRHKQRHGTTDQVTGTSRRSVLDAFADGRCRS